MTPNIHIFFFSKT